MSYPLDPIETIDSLVQKCGETEASKGFREDWELADKLEDIANNGVGMPSDYQETLCKAAKALRNNYVGTKFMLIVSEVAEAMESLRDHGVEGTQAGDGNVGEELSDAHIRLFALEHLLNLPSPGKSVFKKMGVNSNRPHKHGRAVI